MSIKKLFRDRNSKSVAHGINIRELKGKKKNKKV